MLYQWLMKNIGIDGYMLICIEMLLVAISVFFATVIITKLVLPVLRAKKLGQNISGYVPEHQVKQGTPTMGGICFVMATLVVMLIWFLLESFGVISKLYTRSLIPMALTLIFGVANAMIGFIDDYAKLVKKQNEGLTDKQKMALQIVASGVYLVLMYFFSDISTSFTLPFTNISINLGFFAYPIYLLVIVGFVNSTNITDGLDGLASSVGLSVAMGMALLSSVFFWRETGVISATLIGALLGFLVFNHYPAKIFMGDMGSLYIGGIIMGCAVAEGELIVFIIMSLVFILEMLSSLWQRVYYKMTGGKRFFKMAPIHHHFQKLGWSEVKIVTVFFIVSIVFVAIGVFSKIVPNM